jgi:S-adenosylmethionine uptake transporter
VTGSALQSLWIVAASAAFALMGVFVKLASQHVGTVELLLYRAIVTAMVAGGIMRARGQSLRTSRFDLHAVRGLSGFVAQGLLFEAMKRLPLGTAVALNSLSPVYLAGLSFQSIPAGRRAMIVVSIILGFVGAALLLHPTIAHDQYVGGAIGALSGFMSAVTYLSVRRVVQANEPEMRVVFYYALITALAALAWVLWSGFASIGPLIALQVIAMAGLGAAGQMFVTRAYGKGDTLISATLSYSGIAFSTVLGILVWGDDFSTWSWLGMAMIAAAGVLAVVLDRNAKRKRLQPPPATR